ncbi:hypothetical protein QL285_063124 [Trifolium repens]|nr:hypothetical protein QL285_063124 [Trifolium repens]
MQAIRLDLKEKLQKLSDKYTTLKKSRKETVVVKNHEKEKEEEVEKFVDGGSDFYSMSKQNLEIAEEEYKEDKVQDFLLSSLCSKPPPPPFPSTLSPALPEHQKQRTVVSFNTLKVRESASSDIKFLSKTVSAPQSATRPPSKPPDVHSLPENFQFQPPVFLVAQSQPLAPLYSSTSPLINSLPRPPETVSSLLPASPPPLKPPDLHLPLEVFLPPPALLPPPKPPDRYFRRPKLLDVQPPYNFYCTALCLSSAFLKNVKMENSTIDPCDIVVLHVKFGTTSQPLDHFIPILLQSQLCHKTTICLKPSQPTTNSHVSKFAPPTTIHPRDILFSPYFYVSARCLQVVNEFKSYCQLASIHVLLPTKTHYLFGLEKSGPNILFRLILYGLKSFMIQASLQHNTHTSIGLPHTRPTRKPPD